MFGWRKSIKVEQKLGLIAASGPPLRQRTIAETPVAIIDFETTGLNAGADRVVEVTVIRREPDGSTQVALDTLLNPGRRVSATEIHGITDEDVRDAPRFEDIAPELTNALSGCVVAAYNVYFDIRFLEYELSRVGISHTPPHLCLMYMRPMLHLGGRCSLGDACRQHGITLSAAHQTGADAAAAAELWRIYEQRMSKRGIRTFQQLAELKSYKFLNSFDKAPWSLDGSSHRRASVPVKSRSGFVAAGVVPSPSGGVVAHHDYWEALKMVLSDLEVTENEITYLREKQKELGLQEYQVKTIHAKGFAEALSSAIEDQSLSAQEELNLKKLYQCLTALGWAPGQ